MASQDAWSGWIVFAGFVIIIVGGIDILQGFVAILEDEYVVATPRGLAIFDVTAWAGSRLAWGGVLILAGLGLLGGAGGHAGSPSSAWPSTRSSRSRSWRTTRGVSPLEHPDRHAELRRALCADRALAGLQGVRALRILTGLRAGSGACVAPSIRPSAAVDEPQSPGLDDAQRSSTGHARLVLEQQRGSGVQM